ILFEASDVSVHDFAGRAPKIRFRHEGRDVELACDFIGGGGRLHWDWRSARTPAPPTPHPPARPDRCGRGVSLTPSPPPAPPPEHELIYASRERGFALSTMRPPTWAGLCVQCAPDDDIENWPDARIWQELHARIGGTRKLAEGPMLQKGITAMRSFVVEPMQYGRLFLAGDSAHIQPPTGAKGMNIALADVSVLP